MSLSGNHDVPLPADFKNKTDMEVISIERSKKKNYFSATYQMDALIYLCLQIYKNKIDYWRLYQLSAVPKR